MNAETDHYQSIERARTILPAWFVPRMMDDNWTFGLLLATGQTLVIHCIEEIVTDAQGDIWIDVSLASDKPLLDGENYLCAPTSRARASVRADKVVMAYELADT
jgi:hypothetical protein